jgi:serine/threonine protein kinase
VLSSPYASEPLLDDDGEAELTPVVPSFTGLASHTVPLESLERYKLVARLGHGGMAEVFLAAWEVAPFVHQPVVIKRLHTHFNEDQRLVQMFLDEARLLCLLEHPHVVKTLEAGVIDGKCCIAMEYLEGQPLHRVLRRAYQLGKLPIEAAVGIAISVLEGLNYAHDATDASGQSLEIVHRDISPQNVFVTNDGQVKVLDFGIAKARTHEGRTATGVVKGKVGYIAPEQAAGESVDRRADVWSVGVVLWEALAGTRLFKAETDAGTLNLSLRGEIPTAATHRPELPLELEVVLARALQRAPALRYRTAAAMQKDLQSWQKSAGKAPRLGDLGALMRELFGSELLEQRRMVSVLMARSDCTAPAPASARVPSSTSALIVSNAAATSTDLSDMSQRMDAMNKRHRRALRTIVSVLALVAGLAGAVAYFALARFNPSAGNTPTQAAEPRAASAPAVDAARATNSDRDASSRPVSVVRELTSAARSAPVAKRPALASHAVAPKPITDAPTLPAASASMKPETSSVGFLTIDTSPWSQVSVAGRSLGQTPLVSVKLPAGNQLLTLRNPELGIETSYAVQIDAGKTTVRRIGIE